MVQIIFATCNAYPAIQPSDAILATALQALSAKVVVAPWNGPQNPFESADVIVVRSTWDYPKDPAAYETWLTELDSYALVINSSALMRWNLSKRYLLSLAEKGAPLPLSCLVEPSAKSIADAMDNFRLAEAVVKPVYGATASGLSVVARGDQEGLSRAAEKLAMPGIIQPFLPEITSRGETSLIFFDGEFSHAVNKLPKTGEIRCQSDFGGSAMLVEPPQWAVGEAQEILGLLLEQPVYARIDAILLDDTMQLMEVELIEPELFFNYCPEAADRLAAAIMKRT